MEESGSLVPTGGLLVTMGGRGARSCSGRNLERRWEGAQRALYATLHAHLTATACQLCLRLLP